MAEQVIPKAVKRCFMDVVLVRPLNMGDFVTSGGIIKPMSVEEKEMKLALGEVLKVGPGAMSMPLGENVPNQIEVGMNVLFHERCGWPVDIGTERLRAVRENDILMEAEISAPDTSCHVGKAPFFKEGK